MSRLGLKTISFKTGKKKNNLVVLPDIKLLSTAALTPLGFREEAGSREAKPGMPRSHKECIVGHNPPGLSHGNFGRYGTLEFQNHGPAPD